MDKKFYEMLLAKRQVPLFGQINRENFERVCTAITFLNAESNDEIKLLISSGGGDVDLGLNIYDVLLISHAPITGIVVGAAHSMAGVVLQGCTKRVMTPNAELLAHTVCRDDVEIFLTTFGDLDVEKMREHLAGGVRRMRKVCEIFAKRTGRPVGEIIELLNAGKTLRAHEALAEGLIDAIVEKP